ncbi:MAG: YncE family protein [Acidobacteriota bacterium]|nr:YncE family protein [Acidobacteriota bacterium]
MHSAESFFFGILVLARLVGGQTLSPALLVLNKEEGSLAIVDPSSGKIAGRVPTGESPHEVAASADGKLAFVGNYGAHTPGNTITIVDIALRKRLRDVDLGPLRRPHGIVAADSKIYFTAEWNKIVGRYDPASGKIDWLLGTGQNTTHMILVSKDANTIFTANIGSDDVSVFERASPSAGWNATVIPVGKGPEGIDISPDGKQLWAANSRGGSVSIIDIASRRVIETLDVRTKRSNRLKFTPDGKLALISDLEGGDLVILDVASRKEIKRLPLGRAPEGILIEPGGARAYVAISGDNNVAVIDLKTLEATRRITGFSSPDGMAWVQ